LKRGWGAGKGWLWGLLALALAGCLSRSNKVPSVEVISPQEGMEVALGDRVLVQSIATDDKGVIKTELWVDGRLYEVHRAASVRGEPTLDAIQIWEPPALGSHSLMLKAYDADGQFSTSSAVSVVVVTRAPQPTPTPTVVPTAVIDPSCEPSARFVEDVTVPDDSLFNAGTNFVKTWRMRNDGECTWEVGTTWTFISGDLLGAQSPVEVELAEPERIVDVSVEMVAPPSPGTYRSTWRLQRPNGEFFGDQAYVQIIVP
jgi:hypothetical protein